MPEGTLESHLSRGVRALARAVFGTEKAKTGQEAEDSDYEAEHG